MNRALRESQHRASCTVHSMLGWVAISSAIVVSGCASPAPSTDWVQAFGYTAADVHSIDVADYGYPYVPVDVAGDRLVLPFDTGNMVGVSVSSAQFDQMGLNADRSWNPRSSAGETGSSLRVADAVSVSLLGRDLGPTQVYELAHSGLAGLVGPTVLGGGHFTLDYASRRMAVGAARIPDSVPGFRKIPLVRSTRHPLLILVRGTVEGRSVVLELDTGKSRTVINPALASELALQRDSRGVAIRSLGIGDLSFEVRSAKEVDQTGIDASLSEPILVGIGSDILSRFVWTVDYEGGDLWLPSS